MKWYSNLEIGLIRIYITYQMYNISLKILVVVAFQNYQNN